MNIEKILNRAITKFYNGDDVNLIAAELRLTRARPTMAYCKLICNNLFSSYEDARKFLQIN